MIEALAAYDTWTDQLVATLSGAPTSQNPAFGLIVRHEGLPVAFDGYLSGMSPVVLAQPWLDGTMIFVETINIYNADTVACTVTLSKLTRHFSRPLLTTTLQPQDTLLWDAHNGLSRGDEHVKRGERHCPPMRHRD